eukprot:6184119-Pleurochrysis_carterae.AAC.4
MLMSNAFRAESNVEIVQTKGLHVTHQLTRSRTAIGAAIWSRSLPAKGRSAKLAGAAIPGVRIAKLFQTRAHAILNELGHDHHIESIN